MPYYVSTKHVAFGGVNERVDMGDVLGFEYNEPFSFSFWCRFSDTDVMAIISKMGASTAYQGYFIYVQQHVRFQLSNNYAAGANILDVNISETINDNNWHHVVVTYDGSADASGVAIYVDGSSKSLTTNWNTLSATIVTSNTFQIGDRTAQTLPYTGDMDEVSVYNAELSSGDVTAIYNSGTPTDLTTLASAANLVAWWKMGDGDTFPTLQDSGLVGYNLSAEDLSPSGNDGTPTNMESGDVSSDVAGGRALTFNGSDEWVTMGNVLDFDYTDTFSVSFWVWHAAATNGVAVAKMGLGTPYGWAVYLTGSGSVYFAMAHTTATNHLGVYTDNVIPLGAWHHVVVTKAAGLAASNVEFYFDGVLQTGKTVQYDTLSSSVSNAFDLTLGRRMLTGSELYLNGRLDDVAVYSAVLDQTAVTALYNGGTPDDRSGDANLVGYWRMGDGATSPTIPDDSTNSNDGTMTNMDATNFVDGVPGLYSYASFDFGGTNEYVTMGNVLAFERTNTFSFSFWFKGTTPVAGVISKMQSGSPYQGYEIIVGSGGYLQVELVNTWASNDIVQRYSGVNLLDGLWHHVVITYSGSSTAAGILAYVDGVAATPSVIRDSLTATIVNTENFQIGGGVYYTTGKIDEVSVYDVELTSGQAADLYGFGAPVDITALDSWADAVGYWRMGEASLDGTMTNMEASDIVEGAGPGWEWTSVYRGDSQLGRSLVFRPLQDARQELGMFPEASEGIPIGGLYYDWSSVRSPLALTRGTQFGSAIPPGGGVIITNYFRMRGVDDGTSTYTTWTAQDNPDPDGLQATVGNTTPTLVGSIVAGSGVTLHSWQQEG